MAEMGMIERVARALHKVEDDKNAPAFRVSWEQCVPKYREMMMAFARSAVDAMIEPTAAMCAAGEDSLRESTGEDMTFIARDLHLCWQRMARTALAEPKQGEGV